jgi:hypothetical protein
LQSEIGVSVNKMGRYWVNLQERLDMKAIFSANDDFNKSAFMNWRTSKHADIENMLALAEGFLSSGIELAKLCLKDNEDKKADMLIFPILTNTNHGIELYLKALTWTLNILLQSDRKIEGKHNIKQILDTVKAKLKEYKGQSSVKHFTEHTEGLEEYIDELLGLIKPTPKDDKMDFSRYPISEKHVNHFYVDELNNVTVDLENFVSRFEKINEALIDITSYYYYQELLQDW